MAFLVTQWKLILCAILAALLGVQTVRLASSHADLARTKQQFAEERQRAADAARKAEQDAREEEQRREQIKDDIINAAEARIELANSAARDADVAASGLRERVAAFVAANRGGSKDSSSGKGSNAADPITLFAIMLGRIDDAAGKYADAADRARIAGFACQEQYQSLQSRKQVP